jgi:DNA-binding response OmpR family regulator
LTDTAKILIADDENTFLNSTADLLRREGYHCDVAPDGETATKMIAKEDYDLLIADIKMPGNGDLELIRELPRIAQGLPVILVTGYPSLKTAMDSVRLPVVAYLPKPLEWEDLRGGVREAVQRSQFVKWGRKMRTRLQRWEEDLRSIETLSAEQRSQGPSTTLDRFLAVTFQNLVDSLRDLKNLARFSSAGQSHLEVCHLWSCPRLDFLKQGLEETIGVLEKTKSSFKSKELGDLRKKLEGLMETLS